MSPRITHNFATTSTEFQPLPEDTYIGTVTDIEESLTKENQLPMLTFSLEVSEGEFTGRKVKDFVTLTEKNGKVNEVGMGRIKAYAIAALGEEAGNAEEIDTDALKDSTVTFVIKHEERKDKKGEISQRVAKVLPVG